LTSYFCKVVYAEEHHRWLTGHHSAPLTHLRAEAPDMPETAPWKLAPGKTSLTVVTDRQLATAPCTKLTAVHLGSGLKTTWKVALPTDVTPEAVLVIVAATATVPEAGS
jgi:hypothetical protein